MWRFLVNLFAIVGLVLVVVIAAVGGLVYARLTAGPYVPERFALTLDLREGLRLGPPPAGLTELIEGEDRPTLRQVVAAIDRAAADPRVAGLMVTIGNDAFGLATAQELHQAVARFRGSGKPTLAFSPALGNFTSGTFATYLAGAFDDVALSPAGMVGLNGLHAELPYFGGALADLGVEVQVIQREEYKTFANSLAEPGMTTAEREMMERLLDDLFDQVVRGIAEDRGLQPEGVGQAVDQGLLTASEALEAGIIDSLTAEPWSADNWMNGLPRIPVAEYRGFPDELQVRDDAATVVAVITIAGPIVDGEGGDPVPGLGTTVGDGPIVRAIETAVERQDVRGILLRLESGGGSATASLAVATAVARAREAGKPVIASIGEMGASGAYWIAAQADRIIAQPGSLTGSIGVVTVNIGLDGLLETLDIGVDEVGRGANSGIFTPGTRWEGEQRDRIEAQADALYELFVATVAERRSLPDQQVLDIAGGRVWTGREATEIGLVDDLGGYDEAASALHEALQLPRGAPLVPIVLPEPESPLDRLLQAMGLDLGIQVSTTPNLPPAVERLVGPLMLPPSAWTLSMPPILLQR